MLDIKYGFDTLIAMKRAIIFILAISFLFPFSVNSIEKIQGDEEWKKKYFSPYKDSIFHEKAPLIRFGAFVPGSLSSGFDELDARNRFQMSFFLDYYFYRGNNHSGSQFLWYSRIAHTVLGYSELENDNMPGLDGESKMLFFDLGFRYGYGFNISEYYLEPYFMMAPSFVQSEITSVNDSIQSYNAGIVVGLGLEFLFNDTIGMFFELDIRNIINLDSTLDKYKLTRSNEMGSGYLGIVYRTKRRK